MTKRERVLASLRGEPVDRVPLSLWLHNFAAENSAEELAEESVRLARSFDWDFLKPQSRAQCFAEMWGLRYRPSGARATPFEILTRPVSSAAELRSLAPVAATRGALGEQLDALRRIRAAVGPDVPIIWTVFAPLMVLPSLLSGGVEQALALARCEPVATEHALGVISHTLTDYARAAVTAGADGIFYATNVATRSLLTPAECRRFERPFDLPVLEAAGPAPFNVLHVCGADTLFDEFVDYPVTAFSWAVDQGNPGLREGHRRTGRAVMGGLPGKPAFAQAGPDQLAARARSAIEAMSGRWLLLAPDCSINPDTPEPLMASLTRVSRAPVSA